MRTRDLFLLWKEVEVSVLVLEVSLVFLEVAVEVDSFVQVKLDHLSLRIWFIKPGAPRALGFEAVCVDLELAVYRCDLGHTEGRTQSDLALWEVI